MIRHLMVRRLLCLAVLALVPTLQAQSRGRDQWLALARGGFNVPAGATATSVLLEMQPLLASPDPALRDEVAYSAAERWILRDRVVGADDLRRLMRLWQTGLASGLGSTGDDRIYGRTFSALCLSLIAARDVATPFLTRDESRGLLDRLLDYLARERDLRGFDPQHGWMHAVAHTSDAAKFLARGSHWQPGDLARLLAVIDSVIDRSGAVFVWGEQERIAAALHAAVRRPDADGAAFDAWLARWTERHKALWARGPLVDPKSFAAVENTKQVLRALTAVLAMDATPTSTGETARRASLAALGRMR